MTFGTWPSTYNQFPPIPLWNAGPVTHVKTYGAQGDGITDDTAAIQAAINTVRIIPGSGQTRPGRVVIHLQPGEVYVITDSINLCNMQGITLDGGSSQMGAVIIAKCTGKAAFEIIGSCSIELKNIQVWGDVASTPSMAFWVSRSSAPNGSNSTMITFQNVQTYGYFTKCIYYGLETEDNHFYNSYLNTYGGGLLANAYIAKTNDLALTPVHTTLLGGGYTVYNINFQNCHLVQDAAANTARAVYNRDAGWDGVVLRDTYLTSWGPAPIELEGNAGIILDNVSVEGTHNNTVKLTYRNVGDVAKISASNFRFGGPTNYSLYSDDGIILMDSNFVRCTPGVITNVAKPFRLFRAKNCDFTGLATYASGAFNITIDTGNTENCKFRKGPDDTLSWINGAYSGGDIIDDFGAYPYHFDFATGTVIVKVPGTWQFPFWLGVYTLWVDATGDLRIKSGAPINDLDGTVVGAQS